MKMLSTWTKNSALSVGGQSDLRALPFLALENLPEMAPEFLPVFMGRQEGEGPLEEAAPGDGQLLGGSEVGFQDQAGLHPG
jgi:hypothetical protein